MHQYSMMPYLCCAAWAEGCSMHVKRELVHKCWVRRQPAYSEARSQELGKAVEADHAPICVQGQVALA